MSIKKFVKSTGFKLVLGLLGLVIVYYLLGGDPQELKEILFRSSYVRVTL